jgi:hypothetical protein
VSASSKAGKTEILKIVFMCPLEPTPARILRSMKHRLQNAVQKTMVSISIASRAAPGKLALPDADISTRIAWRFEAAPWRTIAYGQPAGLMANSRPFNQRKQQRFPIYMQLDSQRRPF